MKKRFVFHARGCAVLSVLLLAALFAGSAFAAAPAGSDGSAAKAKSRRIPEGPKSIACDEGKYGPTRLRTMSPTEALPAEPQVVEVITIPPGVAVPPGVTLEPDDGK